MKRKLVLVGVCLALVVGLVGVAGCRSASCPEGGPAELLSDTGIIVSQQSTGISVSGEGKVSVVPDVAILSLGVEAQAATVAKAQLQAAEAMKAIFDELDDKGVDKKDIKSQHFSIYPVRQWDRDTEEEILIGYRVTNTVTAKIREVDKTGTIIDAVAEVGGDYVRISGIDFTIDDPTAYYGELREEAMADAKDKAEQLADLGGVNLGKPIYISEGGGYIPGPRDYITLEKAVAGAAPATPIVPGEMEISFSVQVVFSIK